MPDLYRTGGSWGVTIVATGSLPADERGRRPDDRLVAIVMGGAVLTTDTALAERVCALLNGTVTPPDLVKALDDRARLLRAGYGTSPYSIDYINGFEDAAGFVEGCLSAHQQLTDAERERPDA